MSIGWPSASEHQYYPHFSRIRHSMPRSIPKTSYVNPMFFSGVRVETYFLVIFGNSLGNSLVLR